MKQQHNHHRFASLAVWLPLLAVGCANQGGAATTGASRPAAMSVAAGAPAPVAHPLPAPSELEKQYGLQIAHVGLTAAGGLVDVRFKVLDAAKAKALLGNAANAPMLIAGDRPPLMAPHHALHGARFSNGQMFYILYPNTRSAIQPGVEVTVAMGPARLGPVTAQ
ncbi:MAG: hypothetical protein ABI702_02120 [Burkholderiales bacterium]